LSLDHDTVTDPDHRTPNWVSNVDHTEVTRWDGIAGDGIAGDWIASDEIAGS
jgi:hypothetical protein